MSENKPGRDNPDANSIGLLALNAELEALEGEDDAASRERYWKLVDELITLDMNLGPIRRAMGRGKRS